MASRSPTPVTSHEVEVVQAILSFHPQKPSLKKDSTKGGKKPAAPKGKVETKTKEIAFTFEPSEENYLSFLSELLKVHGQGKYTPVKKHTRFSIKILLGKKARKDGIDIDMFSEYEKMAKKILEEQPSRLTVYVDLDAVKAGAKRRDEDGSTSGEDSEDEEVTGNGKNGVERELGRIRMLLEKKYANDSDSGYTYTAGDGEKVPLTPAMMSEWVRAIYDAEATAKQPPNSLAFDPKTRARSLFQGPKRSGSGGDMLQTFSSILSNARALLVPGTPSNTIVTALPATPLPSEVVPDSPAKNTPTKLARFLRYVEENEGIRDARRLEESFAENGYGPDIMGEVDKEDLMSCGLTVGDALRIKRAAHVWWTSPDAKRHRRSPTPVRIDNRERIRFDKRYANNGGSHSVFGPGIIPGMNHRAHVFEWWFYNRLTKTLEKVPDGFVPDIDQEDMDPNALFEPSPSPEPHDAN
ncbi:hypothetical protein BYT27DRAFT_7223729 [Phlegmacium glaucopus]|nr:hypothetical protein BYT27DRAFT_7217704 [Phlegmacium glaucopus]KAF8807969.1 hypothetical protein BYT27DRAFT_7223729 [Phlegmacium glaucopus]